MTRPGQALPDAVAVVLVVAALVVPLTILRGKSATFDEVSHLPAGHSYLTTGLVRLNPQHPPLVKELCALPLLGLPLRSVDRRTLEWPDLPRSFEWQYGRAFLYGQDADRLLARGRVPAVLLSAGLALLVWTWARSLWGAWGAVLAVSLYALDPTIAAHAQLVTTDVGCAFFSVLAVRALRHHVHAPSPARLALAGAALGLALGAKYSALVLLPTFLLFVAMARWRTAGPAGRVWRVVAFATADAALLAAVAWLVLWVIYLSPADPLFYWHGLQSVHGDHDPTYPQYLMGELRPGGRRSYLLIAALVKTPLPTLALLVAAALAALATFRRLGREDALLTLPAASYFVAYSVAGDNIGVRYLIPCLPFLFVFAGRLAAGRLPRAGAAALAGLVLWGAVEFASIAPDHLSYFNQLAGGAGKGYRWLDDSNVDWGQGLLQLRTYLAAHPRSSYRLCYFGTAPPRYYGLDDRCFDIQGDFETPPSGTLVISAHRLASLYALLRRKHGDGPGNWVLHTVPTAVVGHALYVYDLP